MDLCRTQFLIDEKRRNSFRSSSWFIQLTVGMAVFTDTFLYAVIVPVMPFALQSRLHMTEDEVQSWVPILIGVYGGALAVASPLCGSIADVSSSRRIPILFGLFAVAGATVLLQLGPSIGILVLGRVLQGVSAAVVWVVGLAILVDTVPKAELGQAMGLVFSAMSLGVLVGPLLGGVVFERAGYNAVFFMAYALIGVDTVLRLLMIERKLVGQSYVTQDLHDNKSGSYGEKNQSVAITNKALADLPTAKEGGKGAARSGKQPPAIITLLRSARLLWCLFGVMVTAILISQFDSVLPLYVQTTFGWDSTAAGLIFLPLTLTAFLSPMVGWGIDKYGPRWFVVAGFVTFYPFEISLGFVSQNTLSQKILLCALLTMIGICFDFMIPPLLVEVTAVTEAKEKEQPGIFGKQGAMAQAYGLFNLAWAMGSLIGPLWSGFFNETFGWSVMSWSLGLLSLVAAAPMGIWTGGSIFKTKMYQKAFPPKDVKAVDDPWMDDD